jgi:hypothetical protein
MCETLYFKISFGKSHYGAGKKYCRSCEAYYYHDWKICPCCGMALGASPTNRKQKAELRESQVTAQTSVLVEDSTNPPEIIFCIKQYFGIL